MCQASDVLKVVYQSTILLTVVKVSRRKFRQHWYAGKYVINEGKMRNNVEAKEYERKDELEKKWEEGK